MAIDIWPKLWDRELLAIVIAKFSGIFSPVCYLLNHFADLETVYFMDTERFDFDQQHAVTEPGDTVGEMVAELDQEARCQIREDGEVHQLPRWSRYHFQNPEVSEDTPIKDPGVSGECGGIERSFELHSRAGK